MVRSEMFTWEMVLREANYIETLRKMYSDCFHQVNGLLLTWDERGTPTNIALEMLGRYVVSDRSVDYHDLVIQELEADMIPAAEVVEDRICIPPDYRNEWEKVIRDLTTKIIRSAHLGSTGRQILQFLEKQQNRLDSGEYRKGGEPFRY